MASRIDSAGRSGGGWYVRTSGGPFVASRGKPAHFKRLEALSTNGYKCHQADAPQKRCHTLPYVAICSTTLHVVHVRRSALSEAPFS